MDLLIKFYSLSFTVLLCFQGTLSFVATPSVSPQKPVFGDNEFTLMCSFQLSGIESLQSVQVERKGRQDSDFQQIVSFPPPYLTDRNITIDPSIESRATAVRPTSSSTTSASVTFSNTLCDDIAEYKWTSSYYTTKTVSDERTSNVTVKVTGTIESSGYGITSITPDYNVAEGTNATIKCKADVGAEPRGELVWKYYLDDTPHDIPADHVSKAIQTVRSCSYSEESTLTMTMNDSLNEVVFRCTLQQDNQEIGHRQTNKFNVSYSARETAVHSNPPGSQYTEGDAQVTLTCTSRANPPPSYTWVLPNGTEVANVTYTLQNLQINDTGSYTCIAKNGVPNENVTDIKVFQLTVNEKTTTTTTTTSSTTPARSSTTPKNGGGQTGGSTGDDGPSDTTIIIIVVCVVVGVGIIIAIIIICICKRNKKQEIEEPPEKPRNNQDLTFYGNSRPGLTTSNEQLKNSGNNLNTSFNSFDSTDSKPHNPDGLMYSELQFEDKPRSRRPIQILDNGSSTQYADIAMPRV